MRSIDELSLVRELVADGLNDCEIAQLTRVPRSTVREWRTGRSRAADARGTSCTTCGHRAHDPAALPREDYAYLLGLYLGDGCIARFPKQVYRLSVTLDARYPGIISECIAAIETVIGRRPSLAAKQGCFDVLSYSKSWPCHFPQHGPGRKHERLIQLVNWQQTIVEEHPERLLRGLIHSDGWRGTNRVTVNGKRYAYPRYQFTNVSEDIKRIFCDACDLLGIEWRRMNARNISIARRASVARMDEFIGLKA